jgi:hypothetical protein
MFGFKNKDIVTISMLLFVVSTFVEFFIMRSNSIFGKINYVLFPMAFTIFVIVSNRYINLKDLKKKCTKTHIKRVTWYLLYVSFLVIWGIVRFNKSNYIVNEAILLYSFGLLLILGTDDFYCERIFNFSTVVFWLAVVGCFLTIDMKASTPNIFDIEDDGIRFTTSIAYWAFRPFLELSNPLFLYGWFSKTSKYSILQLATIIPNLIINIGLFKFRGSLIVISVVLLAAFFSNVSKFKKIKLLLAISFGIALLLIWKNTEMGEIYYDRFIAFEDTGVVGYRLPETESFFSQIGPDVILGKGLGGGYIINYVANLTFYNDDWQVVHIGWFMFILKGGLPLLICVLMFFLAWFKLKNKYKTTNAIDLTAIFWIPIFVLQWISNPISMRAEMVPIYGLSFVLLARFGKRIEI